MDSAGQDDEVGAEGVAVGQLDRADCAADAAHVPHPALGVHLDAQLLEVPQHQVGGARVQLTFHQALALLGENDLRAAYGECAGGGDTEQPAADDDGPGPRTYGLGQAKAVVHGAERVDAFREFVVGGEQSA